MAPRTDRRQASAGGGRTSRSRARRASRSRSIEGATHEKVRHSHLCALLLACLPLGAAAGEDTQARSLAANCTSCHGPGGVSTGASRRSPADPSRRSSKACKASRPAPARPPSCTSTPRATPTPKWSCWPTISPSRLSDEHTRHPDAGERPHRRRSRPAQFPSAACRRVHLRGRAPSVRSLAARSRHRRGLRAPPPPAASANGPRTSRWC